ncbi:MAG: hypothetical protein ABSF66_04665 [Terriglobales bacterium]
MTVTPEQVLRDTPRGSRAEANFVGLYPINDCGPVVGSNWFFYPISLDGEGWHYINPATGNPFTGGSEFGLPELPDDPDYSLSGDTGNYGQGANNGTTPDKKSCAARLAAGVQNSTGMSASNLQYTGTVGGHANYSFDVTDPTAFQSILNQNMPWSWAGPLDQGHRYGIVMSTHILDPVNGSYSGHTDLFNGHSILAPLHWLIDEGIWSYSRKPSVRIDFTISPLPEL